MARVPTSVMTRNAIKEMLSSKNECFEVSDFMRQAVRLLIEEALEAEAEVGERLRRGYYEHGGGGEDATARGHRNGVRMGRLKSAEGMIEYGVPQVRGIEGWHSEIRSALSAGAKSLSVSPSRCMHVDFRCATSRRRLATRRGAAY